MNSCADRVEGSTNSFTKRKLIVHSVPDRPPAFPFYVSSTSYIYV